MMRRPSALAALATVLVVALSGCSDAEEVTADPSASSYHTLRIGKGQTKETETLAYLYASILEEAGYSTEVVDSGADRAQEMQMMQAAKDPVDVVPEYSGNLLLSLTDGGRRNPRAEASASASPESDPSASAALASLGPATPSPTPSQAFNVNGMSSTDITDTLRHVLPEDLTALEASSASNKDALVTTRAIAAQYGLSTIEDLAKHCSRLTFGVPQGFPQAAYGTAGLKKLYGCVPGRYEEVRDQEQMVKDLAAQKVQVADLYTASSAIDTSDFVVLEDPNADFVAQQVTPVVRDELPRSAKDALNNLSGRLKTEDLKFLNRLYTGQDPVAPKDAAEFWSKHGSR